MSTGYELSWGRSRSLFVHVPHHDSDISDPAPKDGFDEADVITLTHQPIDIRGIPSGLLFSAGLAITWEFPKFRPLFKDPEGNVVTMSEYLRLPFLSGMTIEVGEALTEQNVIPQHTITPLSADEQVPDKTDFQQRVEASDPKIVATRIRKANAAAKRKAEKNRELEGAGGSEGSSKRRKEKSYDHIPCPTPLRTIVAVALDVSRGDNVISPTQTQGDNLLEIPAHDYANTTTRLYEEHHDEHSGVLGNRNGNFDDDVDEEVDLEGPDRHVCDTTERVVIETESIPIAATRSDNRKSIAQEETPMPEPLPKGVGADGAGSSLPLSLFVPSWGIHQRSRVTTPEECRDLMVNLIPPGVREEMNLLDNNVVLDRAWFSLARGAMAQAHTLCQFESLYDTHHALQESLETTRGQLVRTREDFNVVQNFYNTLSGKHRQLREEHAQCSEGLAKIKSGSIGNSRGACPVISTWKGQLGSKWTTAFGFYAERNSMKDSRKKRAQGPTRLLPKKRRPMPIEGGVLPQLWWNNSCRAMSTNRVFPFLSTSRSKLDGGKVWLKRGPKSTPQERMNENERCQDLINTQPAPPPKDLPRLVPEIKDCPSLQDPASKQLGGSKAPPSKKT
ncbi:hypothetical protein Tco_0428461 [Tanacetum coccineum]